MENIFNIFQQADLSKLSFLYTILILINGHFSIKQTFYQNIPNPFYIQLPFAPVTGLQKDQKSTIIKSLTIKIFGVEYILLLAHFLSGN